MGSNIFTLYKKANDPFGNGPITVPIAPIPPSRRIAMISTCSVCLIVSWTAMAMRLWTRAAIVKSFGFDDLAMIITIIFFSVLCASIMAACIMWNGRDYLTGPMMNSTTDLLLISQSFYILTMVMLKISLGFFYFRIMVSRLQRASIYIIVSLNTLFGIAFFIFFLLQCGTPLRANLYWERRALEQCVSVKAVLGTSYTYAAIMSSTDLALAILPIPTLLKSQINRSEKFVVIGIFIVASAGLLASCARIYWIPALADNSFNFLRNIELLAIWSTIEPAMGITATSLATLRPLLRNFLRHNRDRQLHGQKGGAFRSLFSQESPSEGNIVSDSSKPQVDKSTNLQIPIYPPGFPNLATAGSTESFEQDIQYMTFHQTPKLPRDVEANYDENSRTTVTHDDDIEYIPPGTALPLEHNSHQAGNVEYYRYQTEERPRRERRSIQRATWWPLPRSSIASTSELSGAEN